MVGKRRIATTIAAFWWMGIAAGNESLDCGMRVLALEFAPVQPRDPKDLADALQVEHVCKRKSIQPTEENREGLAEYPLIEVSRLRRQLDQDCKTWKVESSQDLHTALLESRSKDKSKCRIISLPQKTLFLDKTIQLGPEHAGLRIEGSSQGESWLSGGVPIQVSSDSIATARKVERDGLVMKQVDVILPEGITEVEGLFRHKPHTRFQAARWPNGDTEKDQWGYSSPLSGKVSVPAEQVREWVKPEPAGQPAFTFVDLESKANPTGFVKDDSTMQAYNQFTSGKGGVCDLVWDTSYGESYWCGNASAGGWAEVDQAFAKSGTVGLPVGLAYYSNGTVAGDRLKSWKDPSGGVIHAWHGQSWFTNAWRIQSHDKANHVLHFSPGGGSQGGRSWCRCDQCGYAGKWCRKGEPKDTRLISGTWYVENVEEELDRPGEFFFFKHNRTLALLLNATDKVFSNAKEERLTLVIPMLETLLDISETTSVTVSNVNFRDSKRTHLKKHGVPSGGDWALYKGAALTISNATDVQVDSCMFTRLDGNAIILLGKTRGVTIENSEFSWLGASAMAAWGKTDGWDGRHGLQPRGTMVRRNVVREIGIYEKQSSAWFQAKACETTLIENTFFNLPRAAVNFNDGFGGGNLVERNLMFNTCRESGDHGAINSWDRQPFLWDAENKYGFDTPPTRIRKNLIIANYGASQGVDNDDGSSFYHIDNNMFYGDGFKMDYGGHDSKFRDNLVLVRAYDGQNCFNVDHFKPGHAHEFTGNTCAILGCNGGCEEQVGAYNSACNDPHNIILANNTYYTKAGNASIRCERANHALAEVQQSWHKELGSTAHLLPDEAEMIRWMNEKIASWID